MTERREVRDSSIVEAFLVATQPGTCEPHISRHAVRPAVVVSTHVMGLGVIRALGAAGVPVIAVYFDTRDMGYLSRYVRERIRAPHPEEFEEPFIALLVRLAARFSGSVLIPASDEALVTVSKHRQLLEQHYIVACPDWRCRSESLTSARPSSQPGAPAFRLREPYRPKRWTTSSDSAAHLTTHVL